MKKFVFMVSFSLMILATLLLAGCGNQKAFAGQASGFGGSGFQCSEGEDCGFVTGGWVVGKISNALSNYVDQTQLNALTQQFVTSTALSNALSGIGMDCVVLEARTLPIILRGSPLTGNSVCNRYSPSPGFPYCVQVGLLNVTESLDSTNDLCQGYVQVQDQSYKAGNCSMVFSNLRQGFSCGNGGGGGAEPIFGDTYSGLFPDQVTCCRLT